MGESMRRNFTMKCGSTASLFCWPLAASNRNMYCSHYYVRQDIEQVFDITKNYASLLPLNVENEETFRGHLLMTFIATALLQQIQNELKNSNFSLDRILMRMRTQKAKVFENVVIPGEPVKEHRQIYKLLGVKCAKEYVRKAPTA